jgi:hypothetical protein
MKYARVLLVKSVTEYGLNSRFRVHEEGTNITKQDKSIRSIWNLIHRMTSSKATQKPAYLVILSSFKIYTNVGELERATRNNLDRFGFGYQGARDPRIKIAKGSNLTRIRITKRYKADPNPSRLAKRCYMNLNIKRKLKATRGNLMNLLDLAKIQ